MGQQRLAIDLGKGDVALILVGLLGLKVLAEEDASGDPGAAHALEVITELSARVARSAVDAGMVSGDDQGVRAAPGRSRTHTPPMRRPGGRRHR